MMARKKVTKKRMTSKKVKANGKFSIINHVYDQFLGTAEVTSRGTIRLKKSDVKKILDDSFELAAKAAAKGQRVRFPIVGALVRKEVKARKRSKGINPFTGEPMIMKARPASKKPRWSFPKALKQLFANKRYW